MATQDAFSRGIVTGLKPYAKKHEKEIMKVTTKEEFKQINKDNELRKVRNTKVRERIAKAFESRLNKKLTNKALIKKQPRATYVIGANPDYTRSSFYNETYQREKKLLSWD